MYVLQFVFLNCTLSVFSTFLTASVRENETRGGSVDCNLQPNHSMPLNPADWTSRISW